MKLKVKLSKSSKVITAVTILLLIGVMIYFIYDGNMAAAMIICGVTVLCCAAAACYMPESVRVTKTDLIITFPVRTKTIPLSSIESVELFIPTKSTVRVCGSGGFYGYWGWFYNRSTGKFFAYSGTFSEGLLVRLTSGRQYLIGSVDPSALLSELMK